MCNVTQQFPQIVDVVIHYKSGTAEGEGRVGPRPHHFFAPPPPLLALKTND